MNLSHLRYFAAVVEHGNVTRAAEALYVSQPTVSAALRSVEREFGRTLFERSGRRLRLNAAGAEAYRKVVRVLAAWDEARSSVRAGDTLTRLRLAALDTLPHRSVSGLVAALRRRHPRLMVTLRSGSAPQITGWLAGHRADAALTSVEAPRPGTRMLWREPFVAMVEPGHRLARRRRIALRDLADEPFVERAHCEIMGTGRELVRRAGVRLTVVARVRSDDLALTLVEQGFGYTLAPLSLATPRVRAVPVEDFAIQRSIVLEVADSAPPEITGVLEQVAELAGDLSAEALVLQERFRSDP